MSPTFFLYAASVLGAATAGPQPGPERSAVVAALRHNEGLLKSLQVDYERSMVPTTSEQAELLRRVLGKRADAYLITPDFAKRYAATVRFWRKGTKQRDEWLSLNSAEGLTTRAFDGQVLRTVKDHGPDGRPAAVIASEERGNWDRMPRNDPMAFLYLYYERPLSEVVASASSFSSSVVMHGKERLYEVSIDCKQPNGDVLQYLFDEHFLPRERLGKFWLGREHGRLVYNHRLVFSDYHAYEMPSGEQAWFPNGVTYIAYAMEGTAPDGSSLETYCQKYRFTKVEFNVDMPDSLFSLEIPKDAHVNDLLTGAGWLPEGKRPMALLPADTRYRRLRVGAIVIAALVIVTTAVFYKRRQRPSSAKEG